MSGPIPRISAVLTTFRRPQAAAQAVASILASRHDSFELVLVDQNSDDVSRNALGDLLSDPRLRYLRSEPCGLSAARNRATAVARAELIACTDDDCEVEPGWLAAMEQAFASEAAPDLVLGQVKACKHDQAAGFVPACPRPASRLTTTLEERPEIDVMGACMGIRRSVWAELGGFTEWIGPGMDPPAGDDFDIVVRALLAGHRVLEAPGPVVIHHGFRTWAEGLPLIDGYTRSTATVVGVRLRGRPMLLARCLVTLGWSFLQSRSAVITSARIVGGRGRRLVRFVRGLADGLLTARP